MDRPTKVVGRRVAAYLVDAVLGFGFYVVLVRSMGEHFRTFDSGFRIETVNDTTLVQIGEDGYALEGGDFGVVALLATAWWFVNLVLLNGLVGGSVGKLVFGIRVVRADGSRCGVGRAILRWLLLVVDAFPYFAPLVGFVCALASEGNRRVGDMAAGTYVVKAAAAGQPVATGAAPVAPYAAQVPPGTQWDPVRQAWIRWDGQAWWQADPTAPGGWRPLS